MARYTSTANKLSLINNNNNNNMISITPRCPRKRRCCSYKQWEEYEPRRRR